MKTIIGLLVAVLTPFVLIMAGVRLLLTPYFLEVEYRAPDFPADTYGFTMDDRLQWSRFAVDYLINDAGVSYLGDLKFTDGTPLYNDRELSHMVDVKNLVQAALRYWIIAVLFLLLAGMWAWLGKWWDNYRLALSWGGYLTVILLLAALAAVILSFNGLFTEFHRVFFTGDSWIFYYSDTLIRLFPMRFWRDAFLLVGLISLAGGLLLGLLVRPRYPRLS